MEGRTWTTKEGEVISLEKLEPDHLINIKHFLERKIGEFREMLEICEPDSLRGATIQENMKKALSNLEAINQEISIRKKMKEGRESEVKSRASFVE